VIAKGLQAGKWVTFMGGRHCHWACQKAKDGDPCPDKYYNTINLFTITCSATFPRRYLSPTIVIVNGFETTAKRTFKSFGIVMSPVAVIV